ncbi:MAG: transporter [bacterium]|nr:transporter [bacterium]
MVWVFCISVTLCLPALAQDADLAKTAQNPVGDLISIPFQFNVNFGVGPDEDEQIILNIQPVYPLNLSEKWNWINRLIVPVIDQPAPVDKSGLGDIQYQGFLTPAQPKGFIWGVGPVLSFPSASEDLLGSEKWSAGAGVVVLKIAGPWVFGGVANNIWSISGEEDRGDVNLFFAQYFVNYNFPGFYLTSAPAITANWEADSDDRWTIPFGGGLGKIVKIGKLPLNCQLSAYYNVEHPEDGAEWQARAQVQLMFPK